MLSAAQIKNLKQKNVSKDTEKTKLRFKEDFSATSSADKKALEELSGQRRTSFYRINDTGSISARVALAMAQILNVSPFYYTGEIDDKQPLQEENINNFLQQHGYTHLTEESKPKQKRTAKRKGRKDTSVQVTEEIAAEPVADCQHEATTLENDKTILIELTLPDSPEMKHAIDELSKDEAIMLLEALYIRNKAGGNTAQLLSVVKRCLLS